MLNIQCIQKNFKLSYSIEIQSTRQAIFVYVLRLPVIFQIFVFCILHLCAVISEHVNKLTN